MMPRSDNKNTLKLGKAPTFPNSLSFQGPTTGTWRSWHLTSSLWATYLPLPKTHTHTHTHTPLLSFGPSSHLNLVQIFISLCPKLVCCRAFVNSFSSILFDLQKIFMRNIYKVKSFISGQISRAAYVRTLNCLLAAKIYRKGVTMLV